VTYTAGNASCADIFSPHGLPFPLIVMDISSPTSHHQHRRTPLRSDDIKGSLHLHTTYSDGEDSLEAMIEGARDRGYRYVAITDHSTHLRRRTACGTTRWERQIQQIASIRERFPEVRILHGAEVDVTPRGTLAFPEPALARLDLCIASVHDAYDLSTDDQTARIVNVLTHPQVNVLGHPLGKYKGQRPPMQVDFDRVVRAAIENEVALEVNGKPERMDLPASYVDRAARAGAYFVLSADAHAVDDHDQLLNAVQIAQDSALPAERVINTQPTTDFLRWLSGHQVVR